VASRVTKKSTKKSANVPAWYRIRQEFYKQIREQVQSRLGEEPKDIRSYRKNYEKEFNKRWKIIDRNTLLAEVQTADLIFLGDFHPLQQSQKSHLRILKSLAPRSGLTLGLECFWSEDQESIDHFVQGKLSEREFLKVIEWKKYWGFPWENYRPLIQWAKKSKARVIGLNGPTRAKSRSTRSGSADLKTRDRWAADRIAQHFSKAPAHPLFVVYGDLHLAEEHLPALVEKKWSEKKKNRKPPAKTIRVLQNSEKIYFQLLKKELEAQVDVVALPGNTFCLLSVPPWVKWQNYLLDLEQSDDRGLDGETLDLTDHVSQYVKMISEELEMSAELSHLSVFTAEDQSLWRPIQENFSASEIELLEMMVEDERPFYLPQVGVAYLSRMSVNHAAALAMHYIHSQASKLKSWNLSLPRDFQKMIWLEALSYFGSKLINPKRKTETMLDVKKMLVSKSPQDSGKEALRLALAQKMHELSVLNHRQSHRFSFVPRKKSSYLTAATLLGGMMGERIYVGYRQKILGLRTLQSFLKKDWTGKSFAHSYAEILEVIESLPVSFKSKADKL